jgi:multidrug efflux pump subunit AcrB
MKTIARFFIENDKLTVVLSIGLFILGIMGLGRMNAESFPAVSMATATIITSYDGATAADIETKITKPLEDEIRGVTGLKDVKSTSQSGLSTIVIRVDMDDPKVDVSETMSDLQKAIDRTTGLPADLRDPPTFTEINSEEMPVLEMAVVGSNEERRRDIIADMLKEEMEDNKNLKGVRLVGFAERAFQVRLNLEAMREAHISVDEVLAQVGSRNTNTPGGAVKTPDSQQLVRIEGKVSSAKELAELVVRSNFSGKTVLLKDIATVEDNLEEIPTRARHDGCGATLLIATKKAGADTLSLVQAINEKVELFKKRYPDYEFHIYNDEGGKVGNRLDVLTSNAVSGLFLVILFLFFFLPGKIGIAASLSLPLAIMGTTGIMPSFGMNLDTITILALVIALGMLVDNSVVISENFTRLRQEGKSPTDAAVESVDTLWLPITATAFTTIAAFLPMLVTKGVMGQFIKYIPIVVTISLLWSLAESFLFLPMRLKIAGKIVKQKVEGEHVDWFAKFEHKFEIFMDVMVRKRYWVMGAFTGILFISIFFMGVANKFILFPAEQTEIYMTRVEMERGTRIEVTHDALEKLSADIKKTLGKDAEHIVARAGVATMGPGDPKAKEGNNVGMITIYVSDHMKNNIPHTQVIKTLQTIKADYVKSVAFEALVNGPPVGNAIEATFRSNNMKELYGMINAVKAEMEKIDGVYDLKVDDVIGDNEIYINIDYVKAARLGLNVANIGNTVRTAVQGKRISTLTLNNKDLDVIVRFQELFRKNLDDLKSVTILDPRGNLVPLGEFAEFKVIGGNPQIKRFDFKRSKTLTGSVNEEKVTSYIANKKLTEVYNKIHADYPGVSLVFGGAAESTKESMDSLYSALVLSLIGIFALLVFLFKSYLRPAIIMTTIPLGLLGFSIAFYLHQRPISFLALIGIIGLGGIIVNSGIVLISFIDNMKEEGKLELHDILVKASGMRLRAVLVTSLTTISGLLPTAYGIGGSDAILIPMTLAMAWGLTSGTILTLVWVPCAYAILEDFNGLTSRLIGNIFGKKESNVENNETLAGVK